MGDAEAIGYTFLEGRTSLGPARALTFVWWARLAPCSCERSGKSVMTEPKAPHGTRVDGQNTTPAAIAERRAKQVTALTSLLVVLLLGLSKLAVGLLTGSLGVVADAIHSGLDLVAASLTALAVRWADRPPDVDHPYGHGRAENVAAFVQALLILVVAAWVGFEAIARLLAGGEEVARAPAALAVMLASIGVSYWRSRASAEVARRHQSAALSAGALNFSVDVWSSLVVLVGLAIVVVGDTLGAPPIYHVADAIAGLAVALVVMVSAGSLVRETVDALLDRSPEDVAARLAEVVARVPGVIECRRLRLRRVGSRYFVDVVVTGPRTTTLPESHALTERIERTIAEVAPNSDVVVHVEPGVANAETVQDQIELIARDLGVRVHDVRVQRVNGRLEVNLHVEVDPSLSLGRAHALASDLEARITQADPRIRSVNTHVETEGPAVARQIEVTGRESGLVEEISALAGDVVGPDRCHDVRVFRPKRAATEASSAKALDVVLHCHVDPSTPVTIAHEKAERLERALRERYPFLGSVLVHVEPDRGAE